MTQSLYERIGGEDALKTAIDLLHNKLRADHRVSHFFDDVDKLALIQHQYAYLTAAFSGKYDFSERSLRESHKHLDLKEEHFTAVLEHFQTALQELGITEDLIDEATAIIMSTHDDVLNL